MNRWKNVVIAADQLCNTLCCGWPDETLSSRAWRWHIEGKRSWPYHILDALFFLHKDHFENSYKFEALHLHSPRVLHKK